MFVLLLSKIDVPEKCLFSDLAEHSAHPHVLLVICFISLSIYIYIDIHNLFIFILYTYVKYMYTYVKKYVCVYFF